MTTGWMQKTLGEAGEWLSGGTPSKTQPGGKPGFAQQMAPADIEAVADYLRQLLAVTPGVSGTTAHGGKAADGKR